MVLFSFHEDLQSSLKLIQMNTINTRYLFFNSFLSPLTFTASLLHPGHSHDPCPLTHCTSCLTPCRLLTLAFLSFPFPPIVPINGTDQTVNNLNLLTSFIDTLFLVAPSIFSHFSCSSSCPLFPQKCSQKR